MRVLTFIGKWFTDGLHQTLLVSMFIVAGYGLLLFNPQFLRPFLIVSIIYGALMMVGCSVSMAMRWLGIPCPTLFMAPSEVRVVKAARQQVKDEREAQIAVVLNEWDEEGRQVIAGA